MGFFSKPEIRQFNYTPRYWDPRKEEMEERRERIRKQLQEEKERAQRKDDDDVSDYFIPRSSAKEDDSEESGSSSTYHNRLQPGFLREQRRTGSANSDSNKWTMVFAISAAVVIVYLALNYLGK